MKSESRIHMNQFALVTNQNGRPTAVCGWQLEPGDTLEVTDLFESTSGNWDPCPVPGITLGVGIATKWVRPDNG